MSTDDDFPALAGSDRAPATVGADLPYAVPDLPSGVIWASISPVLDESVAAFRHIVPEGYPTSMCGVSCRPADIWRLNRNKVVCPECVERLADGQNPRADRAVTLFVTKQGSETRGPRRRYVPDMLPEDQFASAADADSDDEAEDSEVPDAPETPAALADYLSPEAVTALAPVLGEFRITIETDVASGRSRLVLTSQSRA